MGAKFIDIEREDELPREVQTSSIGILLFNEDQMQWMAMRPGTDFTAEGQGVPTKLEPGLWVTNLEYEEARAMGQNLRSITLRSNNFFRTTIPQIRTIWGMDGRSNADAIRVISEISERVWRLSQEAVAGSITANGFSDMREVTQKIERASSLATGIFDVNTRAIRASGNDDKRVLDHFEKAWQPGMFIRGRKTDDPYTVTLSFHFPRLSYAMRLTDMPVPARSSWQVAPRSDDQGSEDFFKEMIALDRPAIFRAACEEGERNVPEYARACAHAARGSVGDTFRSRFIPEEIIGLSPHYDIAIESVACGEGWIPSATGALLRNLEAAAGGPEAARASWSVSVVADNILASASRETRKDKPWHFAESVWLAARDRAAMLPAIGALYDVGAILVGAQNGTIKVQCPADPEMLMLVSSTAWERGLVMSLEDVGKLDVLGVPVPSQANLFGGNDVDYLLSSVVHMQRRGALWSLDTIQDGPSSERARNFRIMLS